MFAAFQGRQGCVQELLDVGASIELRSERGHTAQQMATDKDHSATAVLLQQHAATPKASVTTEACVAVEAVEAELLPKDETKVPKSSAAKKKKKKGRSVPASPVLAAAALEPAPPAFPEANSARHIAAAPMPSARELAMAALQLAIGVGQTQTLEKAINTHATAAGGTSVLKEARTMRDQLAEQQRVADQEAKLVEKREQRRRKKSERAAAAAEATAVLAAEMVARRRRAAE